MYTRCPECQTAFRITLAQLKARDGLVRCGRCDSVFRADLRLFALPNTDASADTNAEEEFVDLSEEKEDETLESNNDSSSDSDIPVISDFSLLQPQRRVLPRVLWLIAIVVLTLVLLVQFAYFYRYELAQLPALRPSLMQACAIMRCTLSVPDKTVPELSQTSIAPHPRYANALRIRANLVNRTTEPLTLPLLQVTLTDNDGKLLARRTFAPPQYLDGVTANSPLGPNIEIQALVDVTNPDNKAAGYEVQLFRQHRNTN